MPSSNNFLYSTFVDAFKNACSIIRSSIKCGKCDVIRSSSRALKLDKKWQPREIASALRCVRTRQLVANDELDIKRFLENTISIWRAGENWTKEDCGCKATPSSTPLFYATRKWLKMVRGSVLSPVWNFTWRDFSV